MSNYYKSKQSLSNKWSLFALCIGFFMVMMDVTIVNVSLPVIGKTFSANIDSLQWVVNSYTLIFSCLLLLAGKLSDQFDTKKVFGIGLLLFIGSSFFCALSQTVNLLIFFRLMQGIGAALSVPASLALINKSYDSKHERAKAVGIWGGIGGVAAAAGPILGGMLTATFGWQAIFYINIPVGLVGYALTCRHVKTFKPSEEYNLKDFDFYGQASAILAIFSLSYSLIEAGKSNWLSISVIAPMFMFIVMVGIFIQSEKKSSNPMIPLVFFKESRFTMSLILGLVLNVSFYGTLFVLPLYFHDVRGYSIWFTSLAILPQLLFASIASYLGGRVSSVVGPKKPATIGLIIGAAGFFSLLIINKAGPDYYYLLLPLSAIGFGTAFTMPAITIAVIRSLKECYSGLASGTFNMSRQVGSLLGVAIFGGIVNRYGFSTGLHIALFIAGLLFSFGALLSWLFVAEN